MAASKKVQDQVENPSNETNPPGDPNLVGSAETAAVQNRVAGPMTACSEYDTRNQNHGAGKYGGY